MSLAHLTCLTFQSARTASSSSLAPQNQIPSGHAWLLHLPRLLLNLPFDHRILHSCSSPGIFSNPEPPTTITAALGPQCLRHTSGLLPRRPIHPHKWIDGELLLLRGSLMPRVRPCSLRNAGLPSRPVLSSPHRSARRSPSHVHLLPRDRGGGAAASKQGGRGGNGW